MHDLLARGFTNIRQFVVAGANYLNPAKSLTNRVLLFQLVWALFVYFLVITALWFATYLVIRNSVHNQGADWIAKLNEVGAPIYTTNKYSRLTQVLDSSLKNFPEIAQAKFLDVTGKKIIAEYDRKNTSISDFAPLTDDAIADLKKTGVEQKTLLFENGANSQMRISAPVWIKSIPNDGLINYRLNQKSRDKVETIGLLEVVLDYSKITRDLNRNISDVSMIIAVMMLMVAAIMRFMVRRALRPLAELEEPLTRLANGETNLTVDTSGDREIARIGIALNTTISAIRERDEALHRMADHDSLTGLINRARFVEQLEQEIRRISRGGNSAALFFFDLDRFKHINDTYGHSAGDRLLIQVTKQLSQRIRENDLFARYGGDEFTLLAYNVNLARAREIAESFISLMHDFVFYEAEQAIKIYFSIGVTLIDEGSMTVEEYLNEADAAVHQAKTQGRNCYRVFERNAQNTAVGNDTGMHQHLKEVLDSDGVILYYQPLKGLKSRNEQINEVLLRLPDKEQNVIGPGAFMPAAERFGLMPEFDRQVIRKAAQMLADSRNGKNALSLNLSEQFLDEDSVVEFLESVSGQYKIDPGRLMFELSYGSLVRNIGKLQITMKVLAEQGYRFAIDDFSADLGMFNYIRTLPIHFLKLEGSFAEHLVRDGVVRIAVRAVVEAARAQHMKVIAKNVGDEASLNLLREIGVDYVQGNYIGAPSSQLAMAAPSSRRARSKKTPDRVS